VAITGGTLAVTAFRDTTNTTAYVTGSFTPTANALLVVPVGWAVSATDATAPTVTGGSLTWTGPLDANSFNSIATPLKNSAWYWAVVSASPSSMTVTATWGSNRIGCAIDVVEFSGTHTRTPRVQGAVASSDAATSISATLANAVAADSATLSFSMNAANLAHDPRASWTERSDAGFSTPLFSMQTQVRLATSEQTGSAAKSGGGANIDMAITVIEIASPGNAAIRRLGSVPGMGRTQGISGMRLY
jgi:hypothetical protein